MKKHPSEKPDRTEDKLELSLEDTMALRKRGVAVRAKTVVAGYNPYDAAPSARKPVDPGKKPTDLRKLSEWIRLQRQVEELKKDKPE